MKGIFSTDFGKSSGNGAGKAPGNSAALPCTALPAKISDTAPALAVIFRKSRRLIIIHSKHSCFLCFRVGDGDSMTEGGGLHSAGLRAGSRCVQKAARSQVARLDV